MRLVQAQHTNKRTRASPVLCAPARTPNAACRQPSAHLSCKKGGACGGNSCCPSSRCSPQPLPPVQDAQQVCGSHKWRGKVRQGPMILDLVIGSCTCPRSAWAAQPLSSVIWGRGAASCSQPSLTASPRSCATRCASPSADILRGWVTTILALLPAPCRMASSRMNCGTWVDLPHPVAPPGRACMKQCRHTWSCRHAWSDFCGHMLSKPFYRCAWLNRSPAPYPRTVHWRTTVLLSHGKSTHQSPRFTTALRRTHSWMHAVGHLIIYLSMHSRNHILCHILTGAKFYTYSSPAPFVWRVFTCISNASNTEPC